MMNDPKLLPPIIAVDPHRVSGRLPPHAELVAPGQFAGEHRADGPVYVPDRLRKRTSAWFSNAGFAISISSGRRLRCRGPAACSGAGSIRPTPRHVRMREGQMPRLPVFEQRRGFQHVRLRSSLPSCGIELRRDLPAFLGHEEEVIDHVLELAVEFLTQFRVLRRNTHRARVQVAFTHHDAPRYDQRGRRKPSSSAPRSAPIATSRPVFSWPSTCTRMRCAGRFDGPGAFR